MAPEQFLTALSRSAGTGGPSISTHKLSLPASSMPITFSTASSRVRMTGPCGRSPKSFMRAVSLFRSGSALVGAIWQVQDNIAVDFGLRGARVNSQTAGEIRPGCNFDLGLTGFEPDQLETILPGLGSRGLTDPDSVPDVPDQPVTRRGDAGGLGGLIALRKRAVSVRQGRSLWENWVPRSSPPLRVRLNAPLWKREMRLAAIPTFRGKMP